MYPGTAGCCTVVEGEEAASHTWVLTRMDGGEIPLFQASPTPPLGSENTVAHPDSRFPGL